MTAPKRDAFVFLAHFFDAEVEQRFFKARDECADICDVVLFVDRRVDVPSALRPYAHAYDFEQLKPMAKAVIGDRIIPGNCHLRAIDYSRRFPDYRFYWFVEYDVVYTGDWGALLARFAGDDSDLLAAYVRAHAVDASWRWTETFATGSDDVPEKDRVLAFLPIHRISARGLETVAKKTADGWIGHFEILVPTALAHCGLSISDIGGSGAWTPENRIDQNYLDWPGQRPLGTLRYSPTISRTTIPRMLYHPCVTPKARSHRTLRSRDVRAILGRPSSVLSYLLRLRRTVRSRRGG